MYFASIMKTLDVGLACKRPTWKGYCSKVAAASADKMNDGVTPVSYWIYFKQRDDDVFKYKVSEAGLIEYSNGSSGEPASTLALDGGLLAGMLASDWVSGTPEEFEAAGSGSGVW